MKVAIPVVVLTAAVVVPVKVPFAPEIVAVIVLAVAVTVLPPESTSFIFG